MMNLIFDLDGTLIDASDRMYTLFRELVPACKLSCEEYWDLKRSKHNHQYLIEKNHPKINYCEFHQRWLSLIEERRWLELDKVYEDTIAVLTGLYGTYRMILLTARQSRRNLLWETERLGLSGYFSEIYVTENLLSKEELLRQITVRFGNKDAVYITDMGSDIACGNMLGCSTVAITHGFMNRACLKVYNPGYVIDNLSELLTVLPLIDRKAETNSVCKVVSTWSTHGFFNF